ncbi:MAG: hypothetical protein ACREBS_07690, partial [Nitrososphaerales archaeon]
MPGVHANPSSTFLGWSFDLNTCSLVLNTINPVFLVNNTALNQAYLMIFEENTQMNQILSSTN